MMSKPLILIMILLLCKTVCFGQCDNTLTPSESPTLAYKFRGNRCEGAYSAKVGAPSMEVASFTIGPLSYNLQRNETIQIKNAFDVPIYIRSTPLSTDTYYRMDASLNSGDTLRWQVKDVLLDLQITSRLLGVYGWVGSEHEKTYLPVKAAASNHNNVDKKFYFIVRPSTRVIGAKYRYALVGQPLGNYESANSSNARGTIKIILPENLNGVYNIEIAAMLESGTGWLVEPYKIRTR